MGFPTQTRQMKAAKSMKDVVKAMASLDLYHQLFIARACHQETLEHRDDYFGDFDKIISYARGKQVHMCLVFRPYKMRGAHHEAYDEMQKFVHANKIPCFLPSLVDDLVYKGRRLSIEFQATSANFRCVFTHLLHTWSWPM